MAGGSGRMVTSSRRAGRITNKTKLLIYRGSEKIDLASAEVILWNEHDGEAAPKHQHVGAKGVESGEMLEHHLQAALSSHSLLHSQTTAASSTSSPPPTTRIISSKPDAATPSAAPAAPAPAASALNYHIPTPDATGLVQNADYAKLYQAPSQRYREPTNFIRFSDTVEEASGGWGGLGYCMDDEDERWLADFNGKQQGGSGSGSGAAGSVGGGGSSSAAASPVMQKEGKENMPLSAGRERRGKGKDKEKEKEKDVVVPPPPLVISEDVYEYVMGVLEKYVEDNVPTLHTDLSMMPDFASVEPLFSSPIAPSFLPSNELPRHLPETTTLLRMSRSIFSHWKDRRERRKGRSIMPQLNYDETNDGDPYVCFRRRDIRATRKTRRTDNFSVEQMQKLQYELRAAHDMAKMVVARELEKKRLYDVEKEVWEAKWKLLETKRRWPSLGMTREEEDIITGRINTGATIPTSTSGTGISLAAINGQAALQASHPNVPRISKKAAEREREAEREKRERQAEAAVAIRTQEKSGGQSQSQAQAAARWYAPDELKGRMQALRQRLEEELARRKEADAGWDDATDASYQPLPTSSADHAFRPVSSLDHDWFKDRDDGDYDSNHIPSFRLRRGRGGIIRLDRRFPSVPAQQPSPSKTPKGYSDWLFPDTFSFRPASRRPRSIDDVHGPRSDDSDDGSSPSKRRRINETWRYDADKGGALGVGMGLREEQDQVIVDDLDVKYMRHRVTLLNESDILKLQPDVSVVRQAMMSVDEPLEQPPRPTINKPAASNQQFVAAAQFQQQQQQQQQQAAAQAQAQAQVAAQAQIEQFQRYQYQTQLQAQLAVQHQQAQLQQVQAQAQAQAHHQQQQQHQQIPPSSMPTPEQSAAQLQPHQRITSNGSTNGTPVQNTQMLPPSGPPQNGRPPNKRAASNASLVNGNGNGTPNGTGSMPPPAQIQSRSSVSPNIAMQIPLPNGQSQSQSQSQSPQMMNGNLALAANGKGMPPATYQGQGQQGPGQGQPIDPALQQRIIAQSRLAHQQLQHQQQHQQQAMQFQNGNPGGMEMSEQNVATISAILANSANLLPAQQQVLHAALQIQNGAMNNVNMMNGGVNVNGNANSNGNGNIQPVPVPQVDLHQQAAMAGYPNVQAYMEARKAKYLRAQQTQRDQQAAAAAAALATQQQQQQHQAISMSQQSSQISNSSGVGLGPGSQPMISTNSGSNASAQPVPISTPSVNGNASGNGSNNTGQGVMNSPALPTGHLQLKLPPNARARLAAGQQAQQQQQQQAAPVQRA